MRDINYRISATDEASEAIDRIAIAAHACAKAVAAHRDRVRRHHHPGAWSDKTRAKRSRRLAKAATRRELARMNRVAQRSNVREIRRREARMAIERHAINRGLVSFQGEFTAALRDRIVSAQRNLPNLRGVASR